MVEEVYGNYSPILMMGRALEFNVSDSMKHESWKNLYFEENIFEFWAQIAFIS
jgi:hypothetical protein